MGREGRRGSVVGSKKILKIDPALDFSGNPDHVNLELGLL